jgi:hypothetical protein
MPARTTRQEARARILAAFAAQLDRLIPEDESVPLKGSTFADFEDQVETLSQAALPVALEERAALAGTAKVEAAGRCPHCGSEGVYLEKQETQPEMRSRNGPVAVPRQHARCRSCGGSFSPSGSCLGITIRSATHPPRRPARGARGGHAILRSGGAGAQ